MKQMMSKDGYILPDKIRFFLFIFFFNFLTFIYSQQETFLALYREQMNFINPAYTSFDENITFILVTKNQWVSIEDAPKTQIFSFSNERKNNLGIGTSIYSKSNFAEKYNVINIDFSYKLKVSEIQNLILGIKAGSNFFKTNFSSFLNNSNDPALDNVSTFNPNFGVGVLFTSNKYWISISIPRIFENNLNETFKNSGFVVNYYSGGLTLNLNDNLLIKPNFILRKPKGYSSIIDINNWFSFKNIYDIGMLYRTNNSYALMATTNLNGLVLGYAYESNFNTQNSSIKLNSHEILLKFVLKNKNVQSEDLEE
ncbi:MAG: PorP/SprF family type IX secretion system membrane protein [Candidatus Woesearchaeota archaeon]